MQSTSKIIVRALDPSCRAVDPASLDRAVAPAGPHGGWIVAAGPHGGW